MTASAEVTATLQRAVQEMYQHTQNVEIESDVTGDVAEREVPTQIIAYAKTVSQTEGRDARQIVHDFIIEDMMFELLSGQFGLNTENGVKDMRLPEDEIEWEKMRRYVEWMAKDAERASDLIRRKDELVEAVQSLHEMVDAPQSDVEDNEVYPKVKQVMGELTERLCIWALNSREATVKAVE